MYIQLSDGKEPTKLQLIFIFDLSLSYKKLCIDLPGILQFVIQLMYIQLIDGKEPTKLQLIFIFDLSLSYKKLCIDLPGILQFVIQCT